MKPKTHKKLNISLPQELHEFCVRKQKELKAQTKIGTIPISQIIASAVRDMKEQDDLNRLMMNETTNSTREVAPPAPRSKVFYSPKKTKRQ